MKSKTKNRLTESEIHALVKLHFGCEPEEIRELKGGMFNAIYRMRLSSSGRDVVLKAGVIPGTPLLSYEQDIMPVEVACYRLYLCRKYWPLISANGRLQAIIFL